MRLYLCMPVCVFKRCTDGPPAPARSPSEPCSATTTPVRRLASPLDSGSQGFRVPLFRAINRPRVLYPQHPCAPLPLRASPHHARPGGDLHTTLPARPPGLPSCNISPRPQRILPTANLATAHACCRGRPRALPTRTCPHFPATPQNPTPYPTTYRSLAALLSKPRQQTPPKTNRVIHVQPRRPRPPLIP